jgi:PA-IL-like protein
MKMFKRTILALGILALPLSALAQESATLTLRSGEKITGQLQDLGGVGFTVQVNGAQRQIPQNDVSVIDFGGSSMSDADWAKVPEGEQRVILKSGEAINGQLADISGSSPLKMTVRTSSGDREISSSEISHIVLSRPSTGVATSGSNANLAQATGNGISVSPKQAWTSTGITVRKGEVLTINASGEVQLSTDANDVATPFGSKSGRKATNAPLPNVLAGALIGRIGTNGEPFAIGSGVSVPMPAAGQLFLGVNDDGFGDNQGEFRVDITRARR